MFISSYDVQYIPENGTSRASVTESPRQGPAAPELCSILFMSLIADLAVLSITPDCSLVRINSRGEVTVAVKAGKKGRMMSPDYEVKIMSRAYL